MISVIIPIYGRLHLLQTTLNSLLHQTNQNFEVVIVDDGNDQPIQLKRYHTPLKTKLLRQKHTGANVARNFGAKAATGNFLLFLDADIILTPEALESFQQTLEAHPEASYVYSSFKFGFKTFKLWPFNAEKLRQMPYIHTASLIRREHFSDFDPNIKRLQDWDLWLAMLEAGKWGVWINRILFRVKTGGTMSGWLPSLLYQWSFLPSVKKYQAAVKIIKEKHHLL